MITILLLELSYASQGSWVITAFMKMGTTGISLGGHLPGRCTAEFGLTLTFIPEKKSILQTQFQRHPWRPLHPPKLSSHCEHPVSSTFLFNILYSPFTIRLTPALWDLSKSKTAPSY